MIKKDRKVCIAVTEVSRDIYAAWKVLVFPLKLQSWESYGKVRQFLSIKVWDAVYSAPFVNSITDEFPANVCL